MTFSPGQPIVWLHQLRGGWGYVWPVDGHIVRTAGQHVIVRVPLKNGRLVERRVRPENLRPRKEA